MPRYERCEDCGQDQEELDGGYAAVGECPYCEVSFCAPCDALHECSGHKKLTPKEFKEEFEPRIHHLVDPDF